MRLGWFWVSNYLTNIVSAFLATGILRMRGLNGQPGWKYLFLIEGILTLLMGLFAFRYMPAGPTQTRNWFTERDEGRNGRPLLILILIADLLEL